jgi:D-arabinose 1-dehydrogenase-like Zn-dependent alcohol dehydrogenase
MPWIYSTCGHCDACVSGDDPGCAHQQATGVTVDGGYAPYLVAPAAYATPIPLELDFAEAAPLFCAGLTVYTPLVEARVHSGMTVAIQGIGGLGHLAVQYARTTGAYVIAIARGEEKCAFARALGADDAIDSADLDPGVALRERGGADLILTTVPQAEAVTPLVAGLAQRGTLVLVGAAHEPVPIVPMQLMVTRGRVVGSVVGNRRQMRAALELAVRHHIRPHIERYSLDDVPHIFERLARNEVRYRAVIVF